MAKKRELESAINLDKLPIEHIRRCHQELRSIKPFEITAYGPAHSDEVAAVAKRVTTDGKQLQHASSSFAQGKWLTRLAALAATYASRPIHVVEIGTCAGISAMYLLAGMNAMQGGHLTSFEGSRELADLSRSHIDQFIEKNGLHNVSYDIVIGSLDDTFDPWLDSLQNSLDLAFVDGNHQEEPTIRYHQSIRARMSSAGIIVHDDIAWSEGMKRAWQSIVSMENNHEIVEFNLGGMPSRGLIFLGNSRESRDEMINTDGLLERSARILKRKLSKK